MLESAFGLSLEDGPSSLHPDSLPPADEPFRGSLCHRSALRTHLGDLSNLSCLLHSWREEQTSASMAPSPSPERTAHRAGMVTLHSLLQVWKSFLSCLSLLHSGLRGSDGVPGYGHGGPGKVAFLLNQQKLWKLKAERSPGSGMWLDRERTHV